MSGKLFVTGTGTEIGKTFIAAAICYQLRQAGMEVKPLKPLISGYDAGSHDNDCATLLNAAGKKADTLAQQSMAPWRYAASLSPHMAAWSEGKAADLQDVLSFCRNTSSEAEYTVAEGAGGVMVPFNDQHTMLDIMTGLRWPVVLVSGSYLGAISHCLTAMNVLNQRGMEIRAVIINESAGSSVNLKDTHKSIELFAGEALPVYSVPRVEEQTDPWKHCNDLEDIWALKKPSSFRTS